MQNFQLGPSEVRLSRVIHGCMGFAPASARETIRTLHAAFDAGITSFDTAPLYGFGESESVLGQAISDRRHQVQILTKVGLCWDSDHGQVLFEFEDAPGHRRSVRKDSRPASLRRQVEASLRRLKVDVIDLLQVHHVDIETPLGATTEVLAALVREGKIRAIGLSNVTVAQADQARQLLHPTPLAALQLEYNLLNRRIERDLLPWAGGHVVPVLAYSPLAQGILAGRQLAGGPPPADWRAGGAYFAPGNIRIANHGLVHAVAPMAKQRLVEPGPLSLAWLLRQPGIGAVIAGARTPAQARANAAAIDVTLADEELRTLAAAFAGFDLEAGRQRPGLLQRGIRRVRARVGRLLTRTWPRTTTNRDRPT